MSDDTQKTDAIYLWDCLHDGALEKVHSDTMARTLTLVVDNLYHWEFHNLPSDTRFQIVGENVRTAEVLIFEPWPGETIPTHDLPWKEAEEERRLNRDKGRHVSTNWTDFVAGLEAEDYLVMDAELESTPTHPVLHLGLMGQTNSNWRDINIRAERFRFFVGTREMSPQEFQEFGSEYWADWASNSKTQSTEAAT